MPVSLVKILLIEDSLAEARLLKEVLKGFKLSQFSLIHVKRLEEGLRKLSQESFDVILLDLTLPDAQGLESLPLLMQQAPSLPIVVLTNNNDDKLALEAVRQGAQDYLVKRQVNVDSLVRALHYAIERKRAAEELREENEALEMEVEARKAELLKAKELNQLKAEFVSMLSHDFRNPLHTILASTGLLQNGQDKLTEEQKVKLFHLIRSAGKSMTQLLDEVLLIGQGDSNQLQCQPQPLALEAFCHELLAEIQLGIGENHQLVFTTQGELGTALWDKSLLRHILTNLLTNAVKYSPPGSKVNFELIFQNENQGEKTVIFKIQDQGIGIPQEYQKHLFHPFRRGENVGSIPGTGLGLAIVKRCVDAHGGEIEVNSHLDMGTTFQVRIPLTQVIINK